MRVGHGQASRHHGGPSRQGSRCPSSSWPRLVLLYSLAPLTKGRSLTVMPRPLQPTPSFHKGDLRHRRYRRSYYREMVHARDFHTRTSRSSSSALLLFVPYDMGQHHCKALQVWQRTACERMQHYSLPICYRAARAPYIVPLRRTTLVPLLSHLLR